MLQGIEFDVEEAGTPRNGDGGDGDGYFRVELPNRNRLVHHIRSGSPFSVQFGRCVEGHSKLLIAEAPFRKVLASLLKVDQRADWKSCLQAEEDDKADVLAFKTAFAPFDPSS
jgi:Protein similar to CwfJ C-terminus 2